MSATGVVGEMLAEALTPRKGPNRRRRVAGGVAALALATLAGTGVAAASDRLPDPAQRLAERFSQHFLPFDFPAPGADDPHGRAHPSGSRHADSAGETLTGPQSPGDTSARSAVASVSPARQPHARRGDAGSSAPAPMGGRSGDGGDDHSSGPSGRGGSDDGRNDDAADNSGDNPGDNPGDNSGGNGEDNGGNQSGKGPADTSGDGSGSQSGHQSGHDDSAGSSDGGSHSGSSGSGDGGSGGDGSDSGGGANGQSG